MKIVLTGFDPFGGESINPAYEALKCLPDSIAGAKLLSFEIPTVFGKSIEVVKDLIENEKPNVIIHIGQAGGRFDITPERVAINYDDARIKDNEGNQPLSPIFKDAPAAFFSTLPIKHMVEYSKQSFIPASVSNTAGTFVCNHVMYGSLYYAKAYNEKNGFSFDSDGFLRSGFIHVPFLNKQVLEKANTPYMSLEHIVEGLSQMIRACVEQKSDLELNAGEIC